MPDSVFIIGEFPFPASPKLAYGDNLGSETRNGARLDEITASQALDCTQGRPRFCANNHLSQTIAKRTLNFSGQLMPGDKIYD